MDSQVIELLGRNRLVQELLRAELEVALPLRDRGVDLVAYAELSGSVTEFCARPIQMKASSLRSFGLDSKFSKFANLIIAYVWNLDDDKSAVTYALTYSDAFGICERMGYTATASWRGGDYVTTNPSKKLENLLQPFKMSPEAWWKLVTGQSQRLSNKRLQRTVAR